MLAPAPVLIALFALSSPVDPPDPLEVDLSMLIAAPYIEGQPLPAPIRALDGKRIRIRGFMDPTQFTPGRLRAFRLTSDSCGCSGRPRVHHFVAVKLAGIDAKYRTHVVELEGRFSVGEKRDGHGSVLSVFRLEANRMQ